MVACEGKGCPPRAAPASQHNVEARESERMEAWTRVHETDLSEIWLDGNGFISRRVRDPWQGRWRWTCERGLPRVDDDGNSSVALGPRVVSLARALALAAEGPRPLPRRFLALEASLHQHRARAVDELLSRVPYRRSTLLNYLGTLVSERPYGETTRLVAQLLPRELIRELYRVAPSLLCGRLTPLVQVLDGALGKEWAAEPHRFALVRLARECRRKRKVQRHVSPSEKGVVGRSR